MPCCIHAFSEACVHIRRDSLAKVNIHVGVVGDVGSGAHTDGKRGRKLQIVNAQHRCQRRRKQAGIRAGI